MCVYVLSHAEGMCVCVLLLWMDGRTDLLLMWVVGERERGQERGEDRRGEEKREVRATAGFGRREPQQVRVVCVCVCATWGSPAGCLIIPSCTRRGGMAWAGAGAPPEPSPHACAWLFLFWLGAARS